MTHFIFGRAFRDSLLGSELTIQSLPFAHDVEHSSLHHRKPPVSNLFRSRQRKRIACAGFALNVIIELLFALASPRFPWLYRLFFIDVSASTLIGLSMIWILIGDWASSCHADRSRLVPAVTDIRHGRKYPGRDRPNSFADSYQFPERKSDFGRDEHDSGGGAFVPSQ